MINKIALIVKILLYSPLLPFMLQAYNKNKEVIDADLLRIRPKGGGVSLIISILNVKNFRNLFYFRIGKQGDFFNYFLPEQDNLHFFNDAKIGKGLLVVHGDSTFINPESMGEYCYINQNVTIGVVGDKRPRIGNNVRIATGAIVLGDIVIGDNVTIAAGAVVVKNVPNNAMVAGNPAVIKKLNGKKVDIKL